MIIKSMLHRDQINFRIVARMRWLFRCWCVKSVTPPVFPTPNDETFESYLKYKRFLHESARMAHKQECIACGRIHVTSEDCDVPERRESRHGLAEMGENMAVGYRLARAEGMGFFNEGVYE